MPWKSHLRCRRTGRGRREPGVRLFITSVITNKGFTDLYLQQGVLRTDDHHFPFINVVVIYEASRKALHRVLVELCNEKKKSLLNRTSRKPSSQTPPSLFSSRKTHVWRTCGRRLQKAARSTAWSLIQARHWTNPPLDHIFLKLRTVADMCELQKQLDLP